MYDIPTPWHEALLEGPYSVVAGLDDDNTNLSSLFAWDKLWLTV